MWSSSGGVRTSPSLTQKIELVGASSTRPCGVTSSASSKPCSRASRRGEHVRRVGERLDAVEHARRRVGDRSRGGSGRGARRQRLGQQQPAAAAREHDPQRARGPGPRRRGRAAGGRRRAPPRGRAAAAGCGAERSSRAKVLLERERPAVVDADHLEHAVAAEQPLVGGRDRRRGGEHDLAVERGERAAERSSARASLTLVARSQLARRRVQTSASRTSVAAAAAMSWSEAHSRTEWYSWPPVKMFGVGSPISLSSEPSVPPRIGVRTARFPRRGSPPRLPATISGTARGTGACCGTGGGRRSRARARGSVATTSSRRALEQRRRARSSSSSSKSRTIARICGLRRRAGQLVGVDEPLAARGRLGRQPVGRQRGDDLAPRAAAR